MTGKANETCNNMWYCHSERRTVDPKHGNPDMKRPTITLALAITLATLTITAASCDNTPAPTQTPPTQTGDTYTPPPLTRQQKHTIREQLQQAPTQWEQEFCGKHPDMCDQGTIK